MPDRQSRRRRKSQTQGSQTTKDRWNRNVDDFHGSREKQTDGLDRGSRDVDERHKSRGNQKDDWTRRSRRQKPERQSTEEIFNRDGPPYDDGYYYDVNEGRPRRRPLQYDNDNDTYSSDGDSKQNKNKRSRTKTKSKYHDEDRGKFWSGRGRDRNQSRNPLSRAPSGSGRDWGKVAKAAIAAGGLEAWRARKDKENMVVRVATAAAGAAFALVASDKEGGGRKVNRHDAIGSVAAIGLRHLANRSRR